jgi:hypothetical protein
MKLDTHREAVLLQSKGTICSRGARGYLIASGGSVCKENILFISLLFISANLAKLYDGSRLVEK